MAAAMVVVEGNVSVCVLRSASERKLEGHHRMDLAEESQPCHAKHNNSKPSSKPSCHRKHARCHKEWPGDKRAQLAQGSVSCVRLNNQQPSDRKREEWLMKPKRKKNRLKVN